MRPVSDSPSYEGGITLENGRHWGFRSDHGMCDVYVSFKSAGGKLTTSSTDTMTPEEMVELAAGLTLCARAGTNFHAGVVASLRANETDGDA